MRYVLTLIAGLILGALLVFSLVVVAPRAKPLAATPVKAPDPGGDPPGTVVLTLNEQFFDALLTSIFQDLSAPKFPLRLGLAQANCPSEIALAPQGGEVRTGVRFVDGKITTPLAFSGSAPVGACLNFRGIAQANINLFFKPEEQTLYGQIDVEGVTLEGVVPFVSGLVTVYVRNTINERVNPLRILQAQQLALSVPVQASGGRLKAQVKDVRSEIKDNTVRLHITYDFSGERAATAARLAAPNP